MRFGKAYLVDYRVGQVLNPDLPLAVAEGLPSAFPPVLSPLHDRPGARGLGDGEGQRPDRAGVPRPGSDSATVGCTTTWACRARGTRPPSWWRMPVALGADPTPPTDRPATARVLFVIDN